MKLFKTIVFLVLMLPVCLMAQTASVTKGCAPLEVNFTAPIFSSYYWDFKDGGTSTLASPDHVFTSPGNYQVEFKLTPDGGVVGTINIKVYADPELQINASPTQGCSPLNVDFTSQINIDPELTIQSINWTFGDGVNSTQMSPNHTYTIPGVYNVSLKIFTNVGECDKTILVEELITVSGTRAEFEVDKVAICEPPATFNISNTTDMMPGNTYAWDFGNGQTSSQYEAGAITYNSDGTYVVTLSVSDTEGCVATNTVELQVGTPDLDVIAPDTVCLNTPVLLDANISALQYQWTFEGANQQTSSRRDPTLVFSNPGTYTTTLQIATGALCIVDTTFEIFVQNPSAAFTIDPLTSCEMEQEVNYTAEESGLNYMWRFGQTFAPGSQTETRNWICPPRDSQFVNYDDTLFVELAVESFYNCKDTLKQFFIFRKPEAYLVPNKVRGCAPLSVEFQNASWAGEPIVSNMWDYGDGNTSSNNSELHTHTFTEPGEYYVVLDIETSDGCTDKSSGVWIFVGEPITPEYTIDKTEVCIGERIEIEITNDDDRIDAWHFDSDAGRFDHCWDGPTAGHNFTASPGVFDATITVDYNGCLTEIVEPDLITVNGAKADIDFMITCDAPNDVMLESASIGADLVTWTMDQVTSNQTSFVHTYPTTGDYTIILEANNTTSGCASTFDTVEVNIRNLEAVIMAPDTVCTNEGYTFDASASVDVDPDCSQGWLYNAPGLIRPIKTNLDTYNVPGTPSGFQTISLIVQDVNGCKDTAYHDLTAYGIYPEILVEDKSVCVPADINLSDLSTADTTIIIRNWSFGSTEINPTVNIPSLPDPPIFRFDLELEDAVGCTAMISDSIRLYEIESQLIFAPGPIICPNTQVFFFSSDFTEEGSFLNYEWDFGNGLTSTDSLTNTIYGETGVYNGSLTYTEDSSGCSKTESFEIEVVDGPMAAFSGVEVDVCAPQQVQFQNESVGPPGMQFQWQFNETGVSTEENPSEAFGEGTHTVTLTASVPGFTCMDMVSQTFTLDPRPEGSFELDRSKICLGEAVTVTIKDTMDVLGYQWDFRDGTIVDNQSPATHTFDQPLNEETVFIKMILQSANSGCAFTDSLPLQIIDIMPEFEVVDSNECAGLVEFIGLNNPDKIHEWELGDGSTEAGVSIQHNYSPGEYEVTLFVSDPEAGCRASVSEVILIEDLNSEYFVPNVFTPNGDERNDFFNVVVDDGSMDELDVEIVTFKIFNRWGEIIYNNTTPDNGWDGRFESELSPAEVYAYYIEVSVNGCEPQTFKGNITLLR